MEPTIQIIMGEPEYLRYMTALAAVVITRDATHEQFMVAREFIDAAISQVPEIDFYGKE